MANVYIGREKEYKREWHIKNRERLKIKRKAYYEANKERLSQMTKLWQMKNAESVKRYKRANKDKVRFGGNRDFVLARDEYRCQVCLSNDKQLLIHHLDETSNRENRDVQDANNHPDNLITLCRSCHGKIHTGKLKI